MHIHAHWPCRPMDGRLGVKMSRSASPMFVVVFVVFLSSFYRHFVAVSDLNAKLLERVLGWSGATFWSCQGSWEACWGHLGSQIDFHRFLVATGTREPSHLRAKLEPCCGQVGTCCGFFGASAALLRIFKYSFNLEDSRH